MRHDPITISEHEFNEILIGNQKCFRLPRLTHSNVEKHDEITLQEETWQDDTVPLKERVGKHLTGRTLNCVVTHILEYDGMRIASLHGTFLKQTKG